MAKSFSELNQTQRDLIKAAILADPVLGPISSGPATDYNSIAIALNADAIPVVKAWLTSAPVDLVDDAPSYSAFDSIAAGKRDSWGFFLRAARDFTRSKVRAWVTDVWGTATAGSNSEMILQAAQENASRAEVIVGGTTRTTGTVSGLDRTFIGDLRIQDVREVMGV